VNDFLRRQSHPESGEVTVRVVHASDKTVEVKPGMKARYVVISLFFSCRPTIAHTWLLLVILSDDMYHCGLP
jgi:hypothetical protein